MRSQPKAEFFLDKTGGWFIFLTKGEGEYIIVNLRNKPEYLISAARTS